MTFPRRIRARARKTKYVPGKMNGLEEAYSRELDFKIALGQVERWEFEKIKLRLADNTFYTPDFDVLMADGLLEFHEVKGFWEDDARVKIKVAADLYWYFGFVAVKRLAKNRGGGWEYERFGDA